MGIPRATNGPPRATDGPSGEALRYLGVVQNFYYRPFLRLYDYGKWRGRGYV